MKKFNPYYNLLKSFGYALWGIGYALTRERNLRIHFTAGAFALYISRYYSLSTAELCLLVLCIGFVIACEMINTAIERTVDLETLEYHSLAKIAKDVAAGAVLVSAITSVVVGFLLFWDPTTLRYIGGIIVSNPLPWLLFLAGSFVWVFLPQRAAPAKRKKRKS